MAMQGSVIDNATYFLTIIRGWICSP